MKRKILTGGGSSHFVTFSVNGRRNLLNCPRTRQIVISALDGVERNGLVNVAGFVVMPDHVHALLWFDDDTRLPQTIQTWKRVSAHYLRLFFQEHFPEIIGHLKAKEGQREIVRVWQKRYYDFNVFSPRKFDEKLDYIHYNPVQKGLAAAPDEYIWSSAAWYLRGRSVGISIKSGY